MNIYTVRISYPNLFPLIFYEQILNKFSPLKKKFAHGCLKVYNLYYWSDKIYSY